MAAPTASAAVSAATAAALSPTALDRQKQDRVRTLRKALSIRPEFPETKIIIDADGTLNKAYFSVRPPEDNRRWTSTEQERLLDGLQRFGVGRYADIQRELLQDWVRPRAATTAPAGGNTAGGGEHAS